ncbi:MAG: sugar kinase [Verrucomicrobiales bacterium]|nr:sugar kinase [Verrucomicrobiales bacterium]|tara:strand:+ start:3577 stop:4467 length:891 start_codon:yes stop_codon:yes gene_type:complete
MSESNIIGIDLGGSSVKAVLVDREGEKIDDRNCAFDPTERMSFAETIRAVVAHLESAHGEVQHIGLSAPGLAAKDGCSTAYLPNRLDGIEGLVWSDYLDRSHPIPVLNDAHAALLGEVWLGAAKGLTNVIMFTLGTGVGGAAMVDGKLLRGHTGKAGHLGHQSLNPNGEPDICGTPGSIETLMGNCTIGKRSNGRFKTTHDLIRAHESGDAFATKVWLESVRALGCAIGSCSNILDPEVCVIGGGIARAGDALFEPLRNIVNEVEWKVCGHDLRLEAAQLGELAGAFGAARNAQAP